MAARNRYCSSVMVVAIVGLLVCGCGGWSKRDTLLELGDQGSLVVDWHQTQQAIDDPKFMEGNPLIGRDGERIGPRDYFIGAGLLHLAISVALPHGWLRTGWQSITCVAELEQVRENYDAFAHPPGPLIRTIPIPPARH